MSINFTPEGAPTEDEEKRNALTELAFKALDTLAEEAPDSTLGDAILLFEVLKPDDEGTQTTVWQESTSERRVVLTGLCSYGLAINKAGTQVEG